MDIINELKNPSTEYRPIPFWSLNDKLEPEMLRFQIQEMKKAGIGGYFMHARGGLKTKYLSDDWMNCIKACVDEGKKLGMNSWCYDENGWPSGFADGVVPAMGEEYHVKWMKIDEISYADIIALINAPSTLGIYSYKQDIKEISRITQDTENDLASKYYVIKYLSNPCYIDILNKDTIKAFIDVTHEKYYELLKEDFGKGIMGFFTDEPQFSRGEIPWSHILPKEFYNKCGYELLDYLPAIFIESDGYEKVRYDFWSLVSQLYVSSFGEQIFNWCEEHNCQLTGHVMAEDNLHSQMHNTAGAMPFYEYMHIPGMDWLGRKICSPVIPKQVSSVANQLGKKQVISETFALCGWDVSFEELKWIAEWQYVNGVNLMCQHLEGYSLKGLRKRDYPPSLFLQQSWWDEYSSFNDYFARLGLILSTGKAIAKVLLIHPIKSAWIAYNNSDNSCLEKLDKDFVYTTEMLSALHMDHHYGDETLISKYGSVDGGSFNVGQCSYQTVILPSMLSIDYKTLELLSLFIDNGGIVISYGMFPKYCEGEACKSLDDLKNKVLNISTSDDLFTTLCKAHIPSIRITNKDDEIADISYCERKIEDKYIYFIVNHSKQQIDAEITINYTGTAKKLCLETTEFINIDQHIELNRTCLKLTFEPMQSHLLVVDNTGCISTASHSNKSASQILELKPNWTIEKMGLNSLTLDYCYYSIDNGPWEGPIHTINIMDLLLNKQKQCEIALKFDFNIDAKLNSMHELFVAIEDANEFDITVNDKHIDYKDIGWWKDSSFKKINIIDFVHLGQNEIILKRNFYQSQQVYDVLFGKDVLETERNKLTFDVELESIYLIGDFGTVSKSDYSYGERKAVFTKGPFTIIDKPTELQSGSFTEQGLCFFSDSLTISQTIRVNTDGTNYLLDLGTPNAPMCKVYVNDTLVKAVLWAPYQVDVTNFLVDGENKISITLYASNRNLLGPHHNIVGESYAVGPSTFTAKAGWCEPGAISSTDMWTDNYCFVKFGL